MGKRVLLFDLGGVLIKLRIKESLALMRAEPLSWDEVKAIMTGNANARAFETGHCSAEVFAIGIIADLNLKISVADFLIELATWPVGFFDGAKELLAQLRPHVSVNCFSNTNSVHWQQDWVHQFDHAIASHIIGLAKPDPAAYLRALEILSVPPEKVWFFDDTQSNVDSARNLNINAYHTDGFDALKQTLMQLSFLPQS